MWTSRSTPCRRATRTTRTAPTRISTQVLAALLQRASPEQIEVDFTRGTKAMSAALVLAATRRAIPGLRYLVGPRDRRGIVEPGFERVHRIPTTTVDGHRRLDLARALLQRGDFAAVPDVLPDLDHPSASLYADELLATMRAVRAAAHFYAAWDRLDYASAANVEAGAPPSRDWEPVWPTDAMRAWVTDLTHEPDRTDHPAMAAWLRRLVVDLQANGERRVRAGQHEDALVRAYRTLELIGQIRLFDRGLDSGDLDPDHAEVKALQNRLEKKKDAPLSVGPGDELQAGRFQVARILKRCGDGLAQRLLDFENVLLLKADAAQHERPGSRLRSACARRSGAAAKPFRQPGRTDTGRRRAGRRRPTSGRPLTDVPCPLTVPRRHDSRRRQAANYQSASCNRLRPMAAEDPWTQGVTPAPPRTPRCSSPPG